MTLAPTLLSRHIVKQHISTPYHNPITIQALLSHYTFRLQKGLWLYIFVYNTTYTFYLHTPVSYPLSRFSPVSHNPSTVISLHVWVTTEWYCICLYTIPPTHSTFTLLPLNSSPGSHLWPRSRYYTIIITLHVWVTMGYHCICMYTIPPTHSTFILPLQVLTCGHDQCTTSHITPHYCYHTTRLGCNGVSLYMSVYHITYTFHLHTLSPGSHLWPWSMYYITYHTTLLLSHYTFVLQWGITVYVCIPYHLHIPPSHSLLLTPLQVLTCGHGQCTTLLLSHYTFGLQWGIIAYVCIPYHLHIPPSYSLSRFSPVAMVNVLHHISHHTTVITLHV